MRLHPAAWIVLVALLLGSVPLASELNRRTPEPTDPSELGLGRLSGGVLTGVLRPMLLSYLWIRADTLYGERQFDELRLHYRTLLHLYPRNVKAKEYLGWHLSFNMKSEAPSAEAAWQWAREGLEYLAGIRGGEVTIALWFLLQDGQAEPRYAGERWEAEKRLRKLAVEWMEEKTGRPLDRFEAARFWLDRRREQRVPPEEQLPFERLYGHDLYAATVEQIAYEELVRDGRSKTADDARRVLAQLARFSTRPDLPAEFAEAYRRRGRLLAALQRVADGEIDSRLAESESDRVAAALWGIGLRRIREGRRREAEALLLLARRMFEEFGEDYYVEEKERIGAWLEHVRDALTPPPAGIFE